MSSGRERRDLSGLAELLFSGAAPAPAPAGRAAIDVVTATACGDPAVAPLLAVALAALPYARPQCVVFGVEDPAPGWVRPLAHAERRDGAPPAWLAELAHEGGRALVVVPPRDTPEVRALGMAGARHVVWTAPGAAGADDLRAFLAGLHLGRAGASVGWLRATGEADAAQHELLRGWSAAQEGRLAVPLGTWVPGRAVPPEVCAFLDRPGPPAPGPLDWAWALLDPGAPRSRPD